MLGSMYASRENYQLSRETVEKALQIDSTLAEAHVFLARIFALYDHDWARAENEIQRATELNPTLSSLGLINHLCWTGRLEEAIRQTEAWAKQGDPLSPTWLGIHSWPLLLGSGIMSKLCNTQRK